MRIQFSIVFLLILNLLSCCACRRLLGLPLRPRNLSSLHNLGKNMQAHLDGLHQFIAILFGCTCRSPTSCKPQVAPTSSFDRASLWGRQYPNINAAPLPVGPTLATTRSQMGSGSARKPSPVGIIPFELETHKVQYIPSRLLVDWIFLGIKKCRVVLVLVRSTSVQCQHTFQAKHGDLCVSLYAFTKYHFELDEQTCRVGHSSSDARGTSTLVHVR